MDRRGDRWIAGIHSMEALSLKPVPCRIWICLKIVVFPHSPPPSSTSCFGGSGLAVLAPHPIGTAEFFFLLSLRLYYRRVH